MATISEIKFKDYLKSELDRRMTLNSAYSMRAFARDLKIPVSRLSELLSGKAGVSLSRVEEIIGCLKLSEDEAQFVKDIACVEFSKSDSLKNQALKRISTLKVNTAQITALDFEEISDWYYFAILEFVSKVGPKIDIESLAEQVGIKTNLCQLAIERLIRKGFIAEESGLWKTTNKSISVKGEPKESIQKFHKQFVTESIKAFQNSEFNEREFSSTFAMLTDDEIQVLRKKISQTVSQTFSEINQNRLQVKVDQTEKQNTFKLYGLGVQLFPIKPNKNNFLKYNNEIKEIL